MKALELTVHGSHQIQDGPGNVTAVYHDTSYGRNVYDWKADQISQRKRLTDPELAAEFHAMDCERRALQHDGYEYQPELERSWKLYQFATLPHYDERADQ